MFWKYYFRLAVLAFAITIVGGLLGEETLQIRSLFDVLDLPLSAIALVGLYGYAWKRQVLARKFWQAFVPIYVIWGIANVFLVPSPAITSKNAPEAIFFAPLILPLYYALVRYAFSASVVDTRPQTQ